VFNYLLGLVASAGAGATFLPVAGTVAGAVLLSCVLSLAGVVDVAPMCTGSVEFATLAGRAVFILLPVASLAGAAVPVALVSVVVWADTVNAKNDAIAVTNMAFIA
jgi:hypothetical protein